MDGDTKRFVETAPGHLAKIANPLIVTETAPDYSRENRIEALRAASRIVAGIYSNEKVIKDNTPGAENVDDVTLAIAEQFAKWLETGER